MVVDAQKEPVINTKLKWIWIKEIFVKQKLSLKWEIAENRLVFAVILKKAKNKQLVSLVVLRDAEYFELKFPAIAA